MCTFLSSYRQPQCGFGCLTAEFRAKAHTNFTFILREEESQEEFVTSLGETCL